MVAKVIPRIFRAWDRRQAKFVWSCSPLPHGNWGLGVSQQAQYDWRQAFRWCVLMNEKA